MKIGVAIAHPAVAYDENYFRSLHEAGVDAIEITRYAEDYPTLDYKSIAEYAKSHGVELWSYHLPFYAGGSGRVVDLTTDDKEIQEKTLDYYTEIIGRATDIGIDKFVVHPCNNFLGDEGRHEHLERSVEALGRIVELAERHGAVIAVENMIPPLLGRPEEFEEIVRSNDKLRVCFDTNHLLIGDHVEFIGKYADRLLTLHVSDFDFKWEKHWLPGEGDINWTELTNALNRVGYNGVWMYEVSPIAPETISRDRDLLYTDYAENARAIFEGKLPPLLGQRL